MLVGQFSDSREELRERGLQISRSKTIASAATVACLISAATQVFFTVFPSVCAALDTNLSAAAAVCSL